MSTTISNLKTIGVQVKTSGLDLQIENSSDSLILSIYAYDGIILVVTETFKLETKQTPAIKICILKVFFTHISP